METVWFLILSVMLAVYVVLDGFDFGVGILHLIVARTDQERRTVLAAIGPLWDGNEVWLLASGGVLVYAFPKAYAVGFSGFYMPLIIVLWLLVLRGLSIEFRSHEANHLWRSFWDGVFFLSSTLTAIVLGAALGNVIRGVPMMDEARYFNGPLFTNFLPGPHPGVLDWYTVLVGVFTLCVLAGHGALYLVYKTEGAVRERSRQLATRLWTAIIVVGVPTTAATAMIRPQLYANLITRPVAWPLVLVIAGGLAGVFVCTRRGQELYAFLASAAFILSMLAATAAGVFPLLLTSSVDPAFNLDIYRAAAGSGGMRAGLLWWVIALVLALGYFTYLFHSFRGKVTAPAMGDGHGY